MQCAVCNTQLTPGSTVSSQCGTVIGGGGAAVSALPAQSGGLSDNAAGAIAYLTIIPAILFLVMAPYNMKPFVRFHAFQCIGLTVVAIAAHILFALIPIVGWIATPLLSLIFLIIWIVTVLKASKGEWFKLPFIGSFAEQQAKKG